ncbi:hypothetical protein NUW58_g422 [Xylaria curta]|nr:hypothetical protein NUW58_g422 [Xylaria curta]
MATSIFEYLTCKNPDLKHKDLTKTSLSRDDSWKAPERVIPWEEFNFQTMMEMFDGRLKTELMRNDRELDYPAPKISLRTEGTVSGEDTTINILTRWNKPIVTAALEAVDKAFHPVFWIPPSLAKSSPISKPETQPDAVKESEKSPPQPPRKCKARGSSVHSASRSKSRPPQPDGAGMHVPDHANSATSQHRQQDDTEPINRLACEIKPGSMWTSSPLLDGELVDEHGKWLPKKSKSRAAWPLVQVYNYCVRLGTRYGFLITSREILAVRIGPPLESRSLDSTEPSQNRMGKSLSDLLFYYGVMEYVAVPWSNCRTKGKYENLTINLTLWVLCILAGQDYRPDWNYKTLLEEPLVISEQRGRGGGRTQSTLDRQESEPVSSDASEDSDEETEPNTSEDDNPDDKRYHSFGPGSEFTVTRGRGEMRKRKRETKASIVASTKRRRNPGA